MKKLKIYCLSLSSSHLDLIENIGYTPVGLGEETFSDKWLSDKSCDNIAKKNPYYGEYTFHYWLWKNYKIDFPGWIGFCQYRKFWIKNFSMSKINKFVDLKNVVLKEIPKNIADYDSIIGEPTFVNKFKFTKFLKHNFKSMIYNPKFFLSSNRTLRFHFNMMHGEGNLDKAVNLIPRIDRNDFRDFINSEVSFNPHNMFICKNKKILFNYYESVFPWLRECEKIFGFKDLRSYGLKRIYGFLAERYMSFWFKKYTKYKILPIYHKDLSSFL